MSEQVIEQTEEGASSYEVSDEALEAAGDCKDGAVIPIVTQMTCR